jgi:hypothetical protein
MHVQADELRSDIGSIVGTDGNDDPRSTLRVCRENVIFCERVGCKQLAICGSLSRPVNAGKTHTALAAKKQHHAYGEQRGRRFKMPMR